MYLMKGVLLDWYSDEKIIFRMIKWNLASKNDSKLWKFPIFDSSDSKSLTRCQKILWICSLGYKNLLNFARHSMKFHTRHHATVHTSLKTVFVQPSRLHFLVITMLFLLKRSSSDFELRGSVPWCWPLFLWDEDTIALEKLFKFIGYCPN